MGIMGIVERINRAEKRIVDLYNKIKNLPSGGGGEQVINEVTYLELSNLITNAELIPGASYKILNADPNLYGGTEITLTATTSSKLSLQGSGKFYCPKYDVSAEGTGYGIWTTYMEGTFSDIVGIFTQGETVTANNGATAIYLAEGFLNFVSGDWNTATSISGATATANVNGFVSPSYSVGQIVHWGGKSWTNLNGNIGASVDKYTLDSEWQEIPFNETDYNVYIDEIHYDFGNDMIIYRKDRYNNLVRGSNQIFVEFESPDGYGYGNPIKDFQWGCAQDDFNTDDYFYLGIQGNEVIESYFETLNTRGRYIWYNKLSQFSYIRFNTLSSGSYFYSNNLNNSYFDSNTLSNGSYFSSNTLSVSSFNFNTLSNSGYFYSNTLNNSSFNSNILSNGSYFNLNILNFSYFNSNTLSNSSYFNSNILNNFSNFDFNSLNNFSSFNSNTLSNCSFNSNTLSSNTLSFNTLSNSVFKFSNPVDVIACNANSFNLNGSIINLSGAIIINSNYSKELFNRQDGTPRLQYVNSSDVIVITDVNA